MPHFFKQMYSDNIFNLEKQFTPKELTAAITVELIARKIKEIGRKHTKTVTGELCSWWNCCEEAKSHIGKEHIWIYLKWKYLKSSSAKNHQQNVGEQTFKLSHLTLHTLSTSIEKTFTFKNLIDYLICL